MLTTQQIKTTAQELQENYRNLQADESQVLQDLQFSKETLDDALLVARQGIATPADVWKLRDYLEEKLRESNRPLRNFSVLKINRWYPYDKTWS